MRRPAEVAGLEEAEPVVAVEEAAAELPVVAVEAEPVPALGLEEEEPELELAAERQPLGVPPGAPQGG